MRTEFLLKVTWSLSPDLQLSADRFNKWHFKLNGTEHLRETDEVWTDRGASAVVYKRIAFLQDCATVRLLNQTGISERLLFV
jgi:hypothetical protein